jgi:hypothetical protein
MYTISHIVYDLQIWGKQREGYLPWRKRVSGGEWFYSPPLAVFSAGVNMKKVRDGQMC